MKFNCIIADPAYNFRDGLKMEDIARGADANYPTMSFQDIKNLPVKNIIDPNGCILALWVPSSMLSDGLSIMEAWGFSQKTTFIWIKTKKDIFADFLSDFRKNIIKALPLLTSKKEINKWFSNNLKLNNSYLNTATCFGMGRSFRACHEICLIGINNTEIYKKLKNKSQRSVCFAENLGHSRKPDDLHKSLELMFSGEDINFLEMFARRERKGWVSIGNEVGLKEDIRVSLKKLDQSNTKD